MLEQPNSELMNQFRIKALFLFSQVNRQRLAKLAQWVDQNNNKSECRQDIFTRPMLARHLTIKRMYIQEAK